MSSRRVNQNEAVVELESPTLLSKLDQLSAQMELAFPSNTSKKDANDDNLPTKSPIKQNQQTSSSHLQLNKPATSSSTAVQSKNENKENIDVNEKSIITDNEISKQTRTEQQLDSADSVNSNKTNSNPISTTANVAERQQSLPENKITTTQTSSSVNTSTTTTASNVNTANTTPSANKHLSAWKRTKILSKTLSSMEVIKVMKSRTANAQNISSATTTTATNNQQQLMQNLKLKNDENQLKKSNSGNLATDSHHLNSPLIQNKRRSQEEVGSTGLSAHRLSSSLSSSCQTSIHNLNESTKANTQVSNIQAALNNLSQNTGAYQIPDNYNTTIINQLNKNYLKNIQKQKARSDWKSLKSKLIGMAKKENEENTPNDKTTDNTESTSANTTTTITTNQRKLSNTNQSTDDGIICKKEDLLFLLRNSNLRNKQRRSNKPSLADVVVQLQESKAKDKVNQNKNQNDSTENLFKTTTSTPPGHQQNNLEQSKTLNYENSAAATSTTKTSLPTISSTGKGKQTSNGRVQFVLSSNSEQNTPTSSSAPVTKIKSSLKKTTSSGSSSIDKSSLIRQTKSNTINNSNLHKKKVKIFETDQDGIRKALILQSSKDRNNNNENALNDEDETNDENKIKINSENLELNEEHHKVKWDDSNVVDAGLLGDAIQAFLSSITTSTTTNPSSISTTTSTRHHLAPTEKKVSFKK